MCPTGVAWIQGARKKISPPPSLSKRGLLKNSQFSERQFQLTNSLNHHKPGACSKRPAQQGHRGFGARSVHEVREDDKGPRTPLADFFNRPKRGIRSACPPHVDECQQ